MTLKKLVFGFAVLGIALFAVSCPTEDTDAKIDPSAAEPARILFFNGSSFPVNIYKNLNPQYFDPTTFVCAVASGQTKEISQYASHDKVIGDAFYPRYRIPFTYEKDTMGNLTTVHVDAERTLSNITFVIENGKRYSKTISQPASGELHMVNGYVHVQNKGASQIQIIQGGVILGDYDSGSVYVPANGGIGFFEIEIPRIDDSVSIRLKAFSSFDSDFPVFTVEPGKRYFFTVNGREIDGPEVHGMIVRY